MMKIKKMKIKTGEITGNQHGVVAVVVLLLLLGVSVLSLNTMLNSHMNQSSSNNYKHRLQTFYAADGLMTLLAQEMIDTSESKYLVNRMSDLDIGGASPAGSHRYDSLKNADTIKGSGNDIWDNTDQFNFYYTRVKGDLDLSVKVVSVINPFTWTKAGIMVREQLTGSSKYVYILRPFNCGMGIRYQYRNSVSSSAKDGDSTLTPKPDAYWIRLKRVGNMFSGYRSADGSSWTLVYQKSIPLTDSVYAGLAVTSHKTNNLSTAVFSNFEGLSRSGCNDSSFVGTKDSIPVKYTIDQTGAGTFEMTTNAYKLKGTTGISVFNTVLNQKIGRERTDIWSSVHDSVYVPVTYYEMRSDMSNPEFNVNAWPDTHRVAHFIKTDQLTSDRKPIKKDPVASFKTCFISFWNAGWYNLSAAQRTDTANNRNWPRTTVNNCFPGDPSWSWCFNDSMHTWFRPYGDSTGKTGSYSFDYLSGRWFGLKVRPGWAAASKDTEWVTAHWNSSQPFANIVLYDSLKFIAEPAPNQDVFTFGKDKSDPRYFLHCRFKISGSCQYLPDYPYRFMPLQNKGFGYDCQGRYAVDSCDLSCFLKQNYAYTMEFHRAFTYKSGQYFSFDGDDDVFVFINNKCVINLGGIHAPEYASVKLDTLGLVEGNQYLFDFFYCERCVSGSDILITTNMLTYNPPHGSRRSWKRDYGRRD